MTTSMLRKAVIATAIAAVAAAAAAIASQPAMPGEPAAAKFMGADVDGAQDAADVIRSSSLIVIGTPVGSPRAVALESGAFGLDYYQEVAVEKTLRGRPVDTVTVVRFGLEPGVTATEHHQVEGDLDEGRQVFFLMPGGTPGTWSVTGHSQGDLGFASGTTTGSDFAELNGQDEAHLGELIRRNPEKSHH